MSELKQVTAMQMRHNLGDLLNEVQYKNNSVIITRASKPVAVLVDMETFEQLKFARKERVLAELKESTCKMREAFQDESQETIERLINEAVTKSRKKIKKGSQ
jgi:prevent-host-death family protein